MAQYVVTTKKAREKFARAHAGEISLPRITQIGFGNGGHDLAGNPTNPDDNVNQVTGEFLKKNIDSISHPIPTTLRLVGILDFPEGNGQNVSACGLYDSDGDLVALKHFKPKPKDDETRLEIDWDEQF
ncbi:phage tail protein [Brevibacillus nitrificans]|uniref:phage tail protein n=1 Tax=Brevibacillus nitrificans TaxID=651560 RepID=UPI00262B9953|nr:phage tail protein [Brevibacillus nitrificans]